MAESYCLKSCTECAREGCAGCKAGAFAQQCDIVKCCKEKNHESCESCTRETCCPTRTGRLQMPEKVFAMERREAELQVKYLGDAAVLAKWVRIIFWGVIVLNGVSLIGYLEGWLPGARWIDLLCSVALYVVICLCYFKLRSIDDRFGTVAVLAFACQLVLDLMIEFVPGENALKTIIRLIGGVVSIFVWKLRCETFRDALSGIHRDMSEKWENQWKLYKISLWITIGGLLLCLILGLLGLLVVVGGLGLMIFLSIREYVYLCQTWKTCEDFIVRKRIF